MAYEKRVCVLKQVKKGFTADGGTLSGAVYAERLGSELTITPRLLGIAPVKEGRYVLAVSIESKGYCLELRGNEALRIPDAPSVRDGFSALVCFVRGEAEPIAFGACGLASPSYTALLAAVQGEGEKKRKKLPNPLSPFESPAPVAPNAPLAPGVGVPDLPDEEDPKDKTFHDEEDPKDKSFREEAISYDDEAIAARDYYSGEADEDEDAPRDASKEKTALAGGGDPQADAADAYPRGTLTYYNSVREKLEKALKTFPKDERLNAVFPLSEWVRAESGALLGIVYENGTPRYLCVAAQKQGDAPAEMEGRASFVPLPYSEDEGFYIVFQDADTGDYVTVSDS